MSPVQRSPVGLAAPALSPFDLNLRHLKGVLAVSDTGSISAAAAVINLSQPALTQGVVKLEKLLGQLLFERRPNGMVTTQTGELVCGRFKATLSHLCAGSRWLAGPTFEPERRLTMTQLRAFLALVDTGSFVAAAAAVGISPAAAHRAVRGLEAGLGRKLIERRGRGVSVNFVGRRFARSCRLALGEIQATFSDLGIDSRNPSIAVGTTPLARAFIVPEAITMMSAEQFPAGFQVFEGSWAELVEALRDGLIDIIVGELPPHQSPDLVGAPLYREPIVIVAGRQHPLVGQKKPSLKALASYPWIVSPQSSPLRAEWQRLFQGRRPASPIECGSIMIIGRLLTSSEMLALATPDQVALQVRSGLLSRIGQALEDRHTIGTTVRASWRPTIAQRRFLQALRDASASMASEDLRKPFIEVGWV